MAVGLAIGVVALAACGNAGSGQLPASPGVAATVLPPAAPATTALPAINGTIDIPPATADFIHCTMDFTLSGWSAIYKTASGHGTVTCDNGHSMQVHLSATGAGLTAGAYTITDGHGDFDSVSDMDQVLGTYIKGTVHGGVADSGHAAVLLKDDVSLTLSGTGSGWDIGVGITGFTISRASAADATSD